MPTLFEKIMKSNNEEEEEEDETFEDELLAQETENALNQSSEDEEEEKHEIPKERKDYFALIRTSALGEKATPDLDLSLVNKTTNCVTQTWQSYKEYTIQFVMDALNKSVDLSHSQKEGTKEVECFVTGQKYQENEMVYFVATLPESKSSKKSSQKKEIAVHRNYQELVYALFYVCHFGIHITEDIKKSPSKTAGDYTKEFDLLEKSINYIDFHLPKKQQ